MMKLLLFLYMVSNAQIMISSLAATAKVLLSMSRQRTAYTQQSADSIEAAFRDHTSGIPPGGSSLSASEFAGCQEQQRISRSCGSNISQKRRLCSCGEYFFQRKNIILMIFFFFTVNPVFSWKFKQMEEKIYKCHDSLNLRRQWFTSVILSFKTFAIWGWHFWEHLLKFLLITDQHKP